MMEWEQQQQRRWQEEEVVVMNGNCCSGGGGISNGIFLKVMTDEQMETLRKQIAAYSTICEQLVELHKSIISQPPDLLPGSRLGNLYYDPSAGHRITGRHRWTPTPMQLQILERIFEKGNGTPSKQKIKDITAELSQHGQISETNVYNWFQNRRARSKRKQQLPTNTNNNNAESEMETEEVESLSSPPNDPKRTKLPSDDDLQPHYNEDSNTYLQNLEGMMTMNPPLPLPLPLPPPPPGAAKLPMSYYDTMLSNPRMDQLMMGMSGSDGGVYDPFLQTDDYDMTN